MLYNCPFEKKTVPNGSKMFSNAVKIENLNDYTKESEECIKPFLYEVEATKPPQLEKPNLIHIKKKKTNTKSKKERGEISITDCLACSGCVTNEETSLLKSQNAKEILNATKNKKINIISLSLQSVIALSAYYKLPLPITQKKLCYLFKALNFDYVFDSSISELITLNEAKKEFLDYFYNKNGNTLNKTDLSNLTRDQKNYNQNSVPLIHQQNRYDKRSKGFSKHDIFESRKEENERKREIEKENEQTVQKQTQLPLLCAHCSGAVIYGEKNMDEDFLNSFSKIKSNQEIQGVLLKLLLLQRGIYNLSLLKQIHSNNFFKFCKARWNFATVCEHHFLKNCNLLNSETEEKPSFLLSLFDINHVYLLYCFDKKIEAHKNYLEQQKVVVENVESFLTHSSFVKTCPNPEEVNKNEPVHKKQKTNRKTEIKSTKENHKNKSQLRFVDSVLTTVELVELIKNMQINFYALPELEIDSVYDLLLEYERKKVSKEKVQGETLCTDNQEGMCDEQTFHSKQKSKHFEEGEAIQVKGDNIFNKSDNNSTQNYGVDAEKLLIENELNLEEAFQRFSNYSIRIGNKNNISMGYGEEIFKEVCRNVFHFPLDENSFHFTYSDIIVFSLFKNNICVFRVVLSYGLKSMYKVISKIKRLRTPINDMSNWGENEIKPTQESNTYKVQVTYDLLFDGSIDYVELMACEKGCLFGCAQNIFSERSSDNVTECTCNNMRIFKLVHKQKTIVNWDFLSPKTFSEYNKTNTVSFEKNCIHKNSASNTDRIKNEANRWENKKEQEQQEEHTKKKNQSLKRINIEHLFETLHNIMHDEKYTRYVKISSNSINKSAADTFLKSLFYFFNKNNFHIFKGKISSRKKSDIINW